MYEVELQVDGKAMNYTTTSHRSVPVVSFKVVQGLDGFGAFPARIRGFRQKHRIISFISGMRLTALMKACPSSKICT
jgi:hypothetical protein